MPVSRRQFLRSLGTAGSAVALASWAAPAKTTVIKPVGNEMKYAQTAIEAPAGQELTIVFNNTATSPAMRHNVVVLKPIDGVKKTVGQAALTAKDHGYIPPDQADKIIAHTPIAPPGEQVEVTFTAPEPGEYPYICTYPGHWQAMQGVLTTTPA